MAPTRVRGCTKGLDLNYALTELRGCIAPVKRLTGPGRGLESRWLFSN